MSQPQLEMSAKPISDTAIQIKVSGKGPFVVTRTQRIDAQCPWDKLCINDQGLVSGREYTYSVVDADGCSDWVTVRIPKPVPLLSA